MIKRTSIYPTFLNVKCPTKTIPYNFPNWDMTFDKNDPVNSENQPFIQFTPKANSTGTLSLGVGTDSTGINMTNIESQNGDFYMHFACDANSNLMTVFDRFELSGCGV